ncbi:MAG: PQQ-binding-like beta-propeller repeat protein [Candidatus Aminicenantes bacterium]|nr:PQQ-binding-like beta-propeller repeat protein [Candidatus Aminicenantes bacterium]
MRTRTIIMLLAALMVLNMNKAGGQSHWSQFRGPNGSGIAPDDKKLPVEFDESKNMIWKCAVSKGNSSPCVWGDRIFLTGYADKKLETICVDRKSGRILWRKSISAKKKERVHPINTPATPTATTDGKRVFVYFGSYGLLCYDFEGREKWKRPLPPPTNMYGTAASPIMAGDYLIFCCDQKTGSYLEAINPETGETVWKKEREGFAAGWSTPMHWKNNGVDELVIYGIWWMTAYDLKNGSERWSVPGLTDEPCITPVSGEGLVFTTSYNMKNNPEVIGLPEFDDLLKDYDKDNDAQLSLEEVRSNKSILSRYDADGEGDHPLWGFFRFLDVDKSGKITVKEWSKMIAFLNSFQQENALMAILPGDGKKETKVVWKHSYGVPECPSPLYYEGRVYMVKNGGIVSCLNAKTGKLKYQDKLRSGGPYYSSPVLGDGKIYVSSRRGVVTVFEPGDTLNILARNDLKERIMATPAIVEGKLYVRTEKNLYAFGLTN